MDRRVKPGNDNFRFIKKRTTPGHAPLSYAELKQRHKKRPPDEAAF
jgi:hypothetical protein